jgi:hypothetical protein
MFLSIALVACTAALAGAQDHQGHGKQHASSGWKEMDAFHLLMMETWHPAEQNDLKPLRAKVTQLSAAARAWGEAAAPAPCATPGIKQGIAAIAMGTSALTAKVKTDGKDEDLKAALKAIHDRFEVIEKTCKPVGK